jgi:hypothetical protein
MRQHKLRSGINWQGALKQEGIKQGWVYYNFKMGTKNALNIQKVS